VNAECIGKTDCSRCHGATGRFCRACLLLRYGQTIEVRGEGHGARSGLAREGARRLAAACTACWLGTVRAARLSRGSAPAHGLSLHPPARAPPRPPTRSPPQDAQKEMAAGTWLCPHCYEDEYPDAGWMCNSSICMKRRGFKPTGIAIYDAQQRGYASVAHWLQAQLKKRGMAVLTEGVDAIAAAEGEGSSGAAAGAAPPPPRRSARHNSGGEGKEEAAASVAASEPSEEGPDAASGGCDQDGGKRRKRAGAAVARKGAQVQGPSKDAAAAAPVEPAPASGGSRAAGHRRRSGARKSGASEGGSEPEAPSTPPERPVEAAGGDGAVAQRAARRQRRA
jgi:hypothetical protein